MNSTAQSDSTAQAGETPRRKRVGRFRRFRQRIKDFWYRVSEGRQVNDLWKQFTADARASYGFYGKDVGWEELQKVPRWRRPFHTAKEFFWALILKLAPARRVLLLIAIVWLVLAEASKGSEFVVVIALLLLLSFELADKVIMKRDLEIAREIQSWLVPAHPPAVAGADIAFATRPQNSVAGDYYDAFFPAGDAGAGSKLVLVIADVVGKSVPAALLMATLQASLRTIAGEGVTLGELVVRLNRYACAHSLDGLRFTTAVICEYDPQTRRVSYVNAGHNEPILRRASGALEKLETGGLPLGIRFPFDYETASVEVQPGDALIFYTDGVVEAFNERGEEFGNERWANAIRGLPAMSAEKSLQFLMEAVDGFVGGTRQSDDITCMVFRGV